MIPFSSPKFRAGFFLVEAREARLSGDRKEARWCLERASFWRREASRCHQLASLMQDAGGFEVVAEQAHSHIDALHKVLKATYVELPLSLERSELGNKLRTAIDLMMDWESDECPF